MGVGKTTLGAPLAKALGLSFIDLDHFIEGRYRKSVKEIFAKYGEEYFRALESKVLGEVSTYENIVISTGGGAPCFYDNIDLMNSSGLTIQLEVSPSELFKRLKAGQYKRPILKGKSDEELREFIESSLSQRAKYYEQAKLRYLVDDLYSDEAIEKVVQKIKSDIELNWSI